MAPLLHVWVKHSVALVSNSHSFASFSFQQAGHFAGPIILYIILILILSITLILSKNRKQEIFNGIQI